NAGGIDLPPIPEQLEQTERQEPPVDVAERLIVIGQRQREPDPLAFYFGDEAEGRVSYPTELSGQTIDFRLRYTHETPIPLPRTVIDFEHQGDFLPEASHINWPDGNTVLVLQTRGAADEALWRRDVIQQVSQQVFRLRVPCGFEKLRGVRKVIRHHHRGRILEPVYQKPAFFIGGEVHRPAHPPHAALGDPASGSGQQFGGDVLVRDALEEAEEPRRFIVELHILVVHDGGDTSEHFRAAPREEILYFGVPVERVPVGVEQFFEVKEKRRHPQGVSPINVPGEFEKTPQIPPVTDRGDTHARPHASVPV